MFHYDDIISASLIKQQNNRNHTMSTLSSFQSISSLWCDNMFHYDDIISASLIKQRNNTVCVHARTAFSVLLVGHLSTCCLRTQRVKINIVTQNIASAHEDELTNQYRKLDGPLCPGRGLDASGIDLTRDAYFGMVA